jgi:DNA-binding Xre family transcriptional regulator
MNEESGAGPAAPGAPGQRGALNELGVVAGAGSQPAAGAPGVSGGDDGPARLPLLPGFREMALRRMSQDRGRLMKELAARRQHTGLSQTEIAARMGTSQSAVARLESGEADVRASTLERYAAALGTEITWKLQG